MRVTRQAKVPKKWPEFLWDSKTKEEFLGDAIQTEPWPVNKVVCMKSSDSVAAHRKVVDELCSHEEADTRVVYHSRHALQQGGDDSCGAHCRHGCCLHLRWVVLLFESERRESLTVGGIRKRARLQKHKRQHSV